MNYLLVGLLVSAFVVIEFLTGGTRFVFSLPSYTLIGAAGLFTIFSLRRPGVPGNIWCLASALLFLGYVLIRALLSPVEYLARPDLLLGIAALIVYLLVALVLTSSKQRLWLTAAILVLAVVNVGLGSFQFMRRETVSLFNFIQPANYGLRATGLYICPNHLAGFLEIGCLLALSLACWSRLKLWIKIGAVYVALACLAGIILTCSRGGYLSTLAGLTAFVALSLVAVRKGIPERFNAALVCALCVVLIGTVLVGRVISRDVTIQLRAQKILDQGDIRVDLWEAALKQAELSPVFGTGSGTFNFYGRYFRKPYIVADPEYAHSDYLQFLAEFGIVGVVALLVFLGFHLWSGWRAFHWFVTDRRQGRGRMLSNSLALTIGAMSIVITYMVHSVFDFNLHIPVNALVVAVAFGMLANPGVSLPFASFQWPRTNQFAWFALPLLGIWMLAASVPRLPAEYYAERARVAERDERREQAIEFARKGALYDKKNPFLPFYLGQAYFGLGEATTNAAEGSRYFAAAEEAFAIALKLYPQDRWLLLHMGWALDNQDRPDEARPFFERAVEWDPRSHVVRGYYAAHLHKAGKLTEAKRQYEISWKLGNSDFVRIGLERLAKDQERLAKDQ